MALAIIDFILFDRSHAKFKIDTGSSVFYKLKIGRSVSRNNDMELVDEVSKTTPVQKSQSADSMLNTSREIAIPANYFDKENCYIQLVSYKTQDGKSPAFSKVIKVPVGFKNAVVGDYILSLSQNVNGMTTDSFNCCRNIPHDDGIYSKQESIEDILLNGIKAAVPAVLELLGKMQNGDGKTGDAAKPETLLQPGILNSLLQALLHGFAAPANVSKQSSLVMAGGSDDNRFDEGNPEYSRPFIFGIDDALLATLAGPLLQEGLKLLPQLLTAQNQGKLQKQAASNKLITDILADTNKRLMLQQVLDHQQPAAGQAAGANVAQLLQLLQQTAAAAPAATDTPAPAADTAVAKSLSLPVTATAVTLSASANLVFEASNLLQWNDAKKALYNKNAPAVFKIKLNVSGAAPSTPLPKAIFTFYFRETGSQKNILQKIFKQKNITVNTFIDFLFTKEEIAALPVNKSLMLFAEMRWLTQSNKELKALGSTEVIVVNNYFVKEQGKTVSDEKELTDMKVYRAFWNKIWEAPVLDAAGRKKDDQKKYLWELDANLKYSVAMTADHDTNGLMETKILKAEADPDSLTEKTEGRMKAGIELSIGEMNKLCTLWDKQTVLPDAKLEALKSPEFAKKNAAELIYNLKIKGKAGQRGMIWVVPVLKLTSVVISKIKTTLPSGQISEVEEENIQFPLPVACRVIGLKSA